MTTRLDYRNALKNKIIGIEDSGYGDFEYQDTELDTYMSLANYRLFPSFYKRSTQTGLVPASYGTAGAYKITGITPDISRVYAIEDATEGTFIRNWKPFAGEIRNLDYGYTSITVHYYAPYTFPSDDVTAVQLPDEYMDILVLAALIEALESRQDTGVRPDPQSRLTELPLIQQLGSRLQALLQERALSLPSVVS